MCKSVLPIILAAVAVSGQTVRRPPPTPRPGSISGSILDQSTGLPLEGVSVYTTDGFRRLSSVTDGSGGFVFEGLRPGLYEVKATSGTVWDSKLATLKTSRDWARIEIRLPFGSISGKVLDYGKQPVRGASVMLIQGQYLLGELRYTLGGIATSDGMGQYRLRGVVPGRRYAILAKEAVTTLNAASLVPPEPRARRLIRLPAYFPDLPVLEAVHPTVLKPGEALGDVDIRMGQSPSYCIEGTLEPASGTVSFQLADEFPTNGFGTLSGSKIAVTPAIGRTGPDGRIRVCDLYPGAYRLTLMETSRGAVARFASAPVMILNRDRRDIKVRAETGQRLAGRVLWDGAPPAISAWGSITIRLEPLNRGAFAEEQLEIRSGLPGAFSFPRLFMDDYAVIVEDVPSNLYVKDITYAGKSVLREPLRLAGAFLYGELRIVVARDGGYVNVRVKDRSGKPVPEPFLFIFSANAVSEPQLAASLITGETDRTGSYSSRALPPGRYRVLASTTPIDTTPEGIGSLLRARPRAKEVEVLSGAMAWVEVEPAALD